MPCINPLHYVDPVMNLVSIRSGVDTEPARPIIITGTKRGFELTHLASQNVGDIVDLNNAYKTSFIASSGCAWAVDERANHVTGVVGIRQTNDPDYTSGLVIFRKDGEWGIGTMRYSTPREYRPFSPDGRTYSPARVEMPDTRWGVNVTQYGIGTNAVMGGTMYPELAFPAARWASELFPYPSIEPTEARIIAQAAEAEFSMRRAEIGLQIQANRRDWGDSPRAKLAEHGVTLSPPVYGRSVSGSMNRIAELTGSQRDALRTAGLGASSIVSVEDYSYVFENDESATSNHTLHEMIMQRIRQDRRGQVSGITISQSQRFIAGLKN